MIRAAPPQHLFTGRMGTPPRHGLMRRRIRPRPARPGQQYYRSKSGLWLPGRDVSAGCTGTVSTAYRLSSGCSCCCRGFGCRDMYGIKHTPSSMGFTVKLLSTCPHGAPGYVLLSGTMTIPEAKTCAEMRVGRDCSSWPNALCGCGWQWVIDEADVPTCGAYVAAVSLGCVTFPTPYSMPYACDNMLAGAPRGATCAWVGTIDVYRATLRVGAQECIGIIDDSGSHPGCPRQSCDDCSWIYDDLDRPYPLCCCTCPQCNSQCNSPCGGGSNPSDSGQPPCPAPDGDWTGFCCGDLTCSGEYQDLICHDPGDPDTPVNCGPLPTTPCYGNCGDHIYTGRRYTMIFGGCANGGSVKGCNPVSCPPDTNKNGDFFIQLAHYPIFDEVGNLLDVQPNCVNDWFQAYCL